MMGHFLRILRVGYDLKRVVIILGLYLIFLIALAGGIAILGNL